MDPDVNELKAEEQDSVSPSYRSEDSTHVDRKSRRLALMKETLRALMDTVTREGTLSEVEDFIEHIVMRRRRNSRHDSNEFSCASSSSAATTSNALHLPVSVTAVMPAQLPLQAQMGPAPVVAMPLVHVKHAEPPILADNGEAEDPSLSAAMEDGVTQHSGTYVQVKKARGRPRKHPIKESPLIKRGPGRPRKTPIVPEVKRPVGRPRKTLLVAAAESSSEGATSSSDETIVQESPTDSPPVVPRRSVDKPVRKVESKVSARQGERSLPVIQKYEPPRAATEAAEAPRPPSTSSSFAQGAQRGVSPPSRRRHPGGNDLDVEALPSPPLLTSFSDRAR